MRRRMCGELYRRLFRRIEQEHLIFQCEMLALSNRDIYNQCSRIQFYECIYEYFQYCDHIDPDMVKICLAYDNPIGKLWELYLENEHLKVGTWEDIEEMLCVLQDRMDNKRM